MQYIIITLLAMTISALLIFLLTNRLLNVHLKIKPLILCVCCALLINIVLPRITMGFVGAIETVGIVVICTIFCAFSIAYYNDRVRQQKDSSNALIQTSLVVQASTNQQGINFLAKREETPKFVHQEKEFESLAEGAIWGKMEVGLAVAETIVELDAVEKMHNVSVPEEQNKNIILEEDDEVMIPYHHLVGVEADVSLNEDLSSPVAATDDVDLVGKTEDVFELAVQEQVAVSENDCKIMINNNLQNQIEELDPINNINQIDRVLELEAEDPESQRPINTFDSASNDLDSLIDIAFVYKEQRSFSQALNVFRQALILYPSSEAAPFLVMEIGAILKNNGQYDEAISVFCEGKKLSGVQKDNVLELEFIKTIAYLRIVKNILLQRHLGFIPFNNIPECIVKEIDAEFREWRNPT
jgi:tetratricopeptide (TPR) repeat protein